MKRNTNAVASFLSARALVLSLFLCTAHATIAEPGVLLNISTRLQVNTSDNLNEILIGGLIIQGPPGATKRVLIRAIGPSLAERGVSGALADTVLAIFADGNSIAGNSNWRDTQEAEIQATGIPPTNDLEAAVIVDLAPGNYTALVYGTVDTLFSPNDPRGKGVALVEVYDLDPNSPARLANLSTRGPVRTGDNVMIGGVIIGRGSAEVLVRAIGPSAGLSLQDPTLELYDAEGNLIAFNDDWEQSQRARIEGTTISPGDPRESAIRKTLTSGNYTAIVRGKNGTTGRGLVEIYLVQ